MALNISGETLDTLPPPTAPVDFGSQQITNLTDPTSAQDGATKNYVDTIARPIGITVDGGGAVLKTGVMGYVTTDFTGTITGWNITAVGASPTCTIDVWHVATGTTLPAVGNTIMGTKPALSTGNAVRSTTLTGWNPVTFSPGDIWAFNLDAVTNATYINFNLEVTGH